LGEFLIQRDESNRVTGLVVRDLRMETIAGACAFYLLQAAVGSLTDYLHVPVESTESDATYLTIDRSDSHLDRELDAVLATLVQGLKMLEKEYPDDLLVQEATIGVEV